MSGDAMDSLGFALEESDTARSTWRGTAEHLIEHYPGTLLAALAEAGVLEDRAGAWDDGFDAGHQAARAVNPEWPGVPSNPYRTGTEESTDARA